MSKNNGLPTGIKYTSGAYRWCVTYKGQRLTGSHKMLNQAVVDREQALLHLSCGNNGSNVSVFSTTDNRRKPKPIKDECPTLSEAIDIMLSTEWKDAKSIRTIKGRAEIIKSLLGEDIKIYSITSKVIDKFITKLDARGVKGPTVNRYLSILSKVLSRAKRRGWIEIKPDIERRKESSGRIRCLSAEEEKRILEYYASKNMHRIYYVVQILIDTGIRVGELFKLRKKDVHFDEGTNGIIYLYDTKNSFSRAVPLTSRAKAAFDYLIKTSKDAEKVQHEYYGWVIKCWKKVRQHMELESDPNFVPHVLRHTCCTRLIKNNASVTKVQKWMGHSTIQTTMHYTHLAANDILNLADLLEEKEQEVNVN